MKKGIRNDSFFIFTNEFWARLRLSSEQTQVCRQKVRRQTDPTHGGSGFFQTLVLKISICSSIFQYEGPVC